jgi:hypothetical protein
MLNRLREKTLFAKGRRLPTQWEPLEATYTIFLTASYIYPKLTPKSADPETASLPGA